MNEFDFSGDDASVEAIDSHRKAVRELRSRSHEIPVFHCTASGGNGHFIVNGVSVEFGDLNRILIELTPTNTIIPLEPVARIVKNFTPESPCQFCQAAALNSPPADSR